MTITLTVIPMHLKDNGCVYGHNLEPIGWWPLSTLTQANLRKLWRQRSRVWLDGDYDIVRVEKAL